MRTAFSSTAFTRLRNLRTLARTFVELYQTQNLVVVSDEPFFIDNEDGDPYPDSGVILLIPAANLHQVEDAHYVWEELSYIAQAAKRNAYTEAELRKFEEWAGYLLAVLNIELVMFDEVLPTFFGLAENLIN